MDLSGTNVSSNSSETNEYSGEWARDNKMSWSGMERAFQHQVGLGDSEAELPDIVEGGFQQQAGLGDSEAELPDTVERASMEIDCSKSDIQKQGIVVMDLTTEVEEKTSAPTQIPLPEEEVIAETEALKSTTWTVLKRAMTINRQQQPQHRQEEENREETKMEMRWRVCREHCKQQEETNAS